MAQQHVVRGVATTVVDTSEMVVVTYHATAVFKLDRLHSTVTLDTGGYSTATTKTRMNQACSQFDVPLRVVQRDHSWYIMRFEPKTRNLVETIDFDAASITLKL